MSSKNKNNNNNNNFNNNSITFQIESKLFKLHQNKNSGIKIFSFYDFSKKTKEQISKDFNEAGLDSQTIATLIKSIGLKSENAEKFLKENKIKIPLNVYKNLFKNIYKDFYSKTKKIIEKNNKNIKFDNLNKKLQEFLIDLFFTENLNNEILFNLKEILNKITKNKNYSELNKINTLLHKKIKKENNNEKIAIERMKLRTKLIKELINENSKNSTKNKNNSTKNNINENDSIATASTTPTISRSSSKIHINQPKGGIDLSIDIQKLISHSSDIKFQGIILQENNLLLFNSKSNKNNKKSLCNLEDLAIILKILYDPSIKCKNISFSLDPYEPTNPMGPYYKKVYYPDVIENKRILAGTKLGEEMFEADYLMKQMCLGYKPDNKTKFDYPDELKKHGLKSIYENINNNIKNVNENEHQWGRVWIIVKEIKTLAKKGNFFGVDNIKMGIDARQMNVNKNGCLEDSLIQDSNNEIFKFAKKLSELYENCAKIYKCFYRLKEITNALAIGKFIYENGISVDLNLINKIYEKNIIKNYNEKIDSIHFSEKIQYEEKIPVDLNKIAEDLLKKNNVEVNKENIEKTIKTIKEKNAGKELCNKRIKVIQKHRFGGVDIWTNIVKNKCEKNLLENKIIEKNNKIIEKNNKNNKNESLNSSISTTNEDSLLNIISTEKNGEINIDLSNCDVHVFPLEKINKCEICKNNLDIDENRMCLLLKKMLNGKFYCSVHNPFSCANCQDFILDSCATVKDEKFHAKCLNCFECDKNLDKESVCSESGLLFHKNCFVEYQKKLNEFLNEK
jgi:hypothetical protein